MKNLLLSVCSMVLISCVSEQASMKCVNDCTPISQLAKTTFYAYVTNYSDNTISTYSLKASSGQIEQVGSFSSGGSNPYGIARHPNNKFLYVANAGSDSVGVFSIDQSSGDLSQVSSAVAGDFPHAIAMNSSGTRLYVVNEVSNDVMSFSVNGATGALTYVDTILTGNPSDAAPHDIKIVGDQFVYVANFATASNSINVFEIQANGSLVLVEEEAAGVRPFRLTVSSDSKYLYAINRASDEVKVYSIGATGDLTLVQSIATGTTPTSLVIAGGYAYVSHFTGTDVAIYSVDSTTGLLTRLDYSSLYGSTDAPLAFSASRVFKHPNVDYIFTMHENDKKIRAFNRKADGFMEYVNQEATTGTNPLWIEFVTIVK